MALDICRVWVVVARRFLICFICALCLAPIARAETLAELVKPARGGDVGVFGAAELRVAGGRLPAHWARVLAETARQPDDTASPMWRHMIAGAAGLSRRQRIDYVNRYFNAWPYRLDIDAYGVSDYWASPREFMLWSGDCEDFAIAKFLALRRLGFGNDALRLALVFDTARSIVHAVVALRFDGQVLVLDSLSNEILPLTRYAHYRARYSVNEAGVWLHSLPARLAAAPAVPANPIR